MAGLNDTFSSGQINPYSTMGIMKKKGSFGFVASSIMWSKELFSTEHNEGEPSFRQRGLKLLIFHIPQNNPAGQGLIKMKFSCECFSFES